LDSDYTVAFHAVVAVPARDSLGLLGQVLMVIPHVTQWLSFAAISGTAAEYFKVSETAINWLSTAYMFAFVSVSPYAQPFNPNLLRCPY
jgi:MFS transporter, FLVCR family, MFS-domain-containing protein 7